MKIMLDKTSGLKSNNISQMNNIIYNLWRYFENKVVQNKASKPSVTNKAKPSNNISRFIYREQNNIFCASFVMSVSNQVLLFEREGLSTITSVATSDSNSKLTYEAPGYFEINNNKLYFHSNRKDIKELSDKYYVYITGELV